MSVMKEALQAAGVLAIFGVVIIGGFKGTHVIMEKGKKDGIEECDAEHKITEDALRRERDERSTALTAALYLANVADENLIPDKAVSVTVCVSDDDLGVAIILDQRFLCDETWTTVTFPIIYGWDEARSIGRPSIGTDIETHVVTMH